MEKEKKAVGGAGSSSDSQRKRDFQAKQKQACDKSLNFVVFHALIINFQKRSEKSKDKVVAAFHKYDSNKDGYLSKDEFGVVSSLSYSRHLILKIN